MEPEDYQYLLIQLKFLLGQYISVNIQNIVVTKTPLISLALLNV
jgi:hypothetical protein